MTEDDAPHLTPETVEEYFRAGVPVAFTLSEKMGARLEIDPGHQQLRLVTPAFGAEPDVTSFERIFVERGPIKGSPGDWYRLSVNAAGMRYEAYVLIESIVGRLREGASFRRAVLESLAGLKGVLAARRRLTDEKEAGLIGELLVLEHLCGTHDEDTAMRAWLGPLSEEHDFALAEFDAEVKTTRSEGRVHRIGTETQLQPSAGRPLYLVSIQITLAGDAKEGFTLPDLAERIGRDLDKTRTDYDRHLQDVGYRAADSDLYPGRWQLRAQPRAYIVDDTFPAITGTLLEQHVPQSTLVSTVSYRVDVSHLPHVRIPAPLADFCEDPA